MKKLFPFILFIGIVFTGSTSSILANEQISNRLKINDLSLVLMNPSPLDSCGIDNQSEMNVFEAEFLNDYYRSRGSFDFSGKKIAFVTGGGGSIISTKSEYFSHVKQWKDNHNTTIETKLVVLKEDEKALSGGYDAIVLFWVKIFTKSQRSKILVRLGSE